MKSPISASLIAGLLLVLIVTPLQAKEDAKRLYEKALLSEQNLKNSAVLQNQIQEWKKVAGAFRAVYYTYPSSGYCDNALFRVGTLYAEMGSRFQDSLYFRRAGSAYQFLIEQYSSSSLVEDAMLEYIRILRYELNNELEARSMEERLRARSPAKAQALSRGPSPSPGQRATLQDLRYYTGTEYTRVVIDLDREAAFKRNRLTDPDRLYIDLENTVVKRSLIRQSVPVDDGFLRQIRIGQNTESRARVVLDLKSIETYEIFPLYHPYRVIIDIQGKKSAASTADAAQQKPAEPPVMAQTNTNGQYSLARQLGLKVQRIILDPGHGGHDPGAMHAGLREKDITIDVSSRLKSILENEYGYEVLMTREADLYVALEERTAFANSNGADLFVSIHVNSSRNRYAKGIETYYLNFATSPEAMEVAARENAIAEKNMAELQKLTTAIALNSKIEESRDFANLIQANLMAKLHKQYGVQNLGVKQAPFYVLIGAQMPSILAEISFLSNERESGLLSKTSYRQSVAEGIATGIKSYVETLAGNKITQNRVSSN